MKDQRTTIKVSKETKAEFDKLHKELQLKNHDVTLIGLIKQEVHTGWELGRCRMHIHQLMEEIKRNETSDEVIKKFKSCTESNPFVHKGVTCGMSDKEIIIALCEHMREMNLETLHMMDKHQIVERSINENIRGLFHD